MAKSFDELIGKTGNKKTKKIATKRTQELLDAEFLSWLVCGRGLLLKNIWRITND